MARRKGGGGATEKGNEREKQARTEVDFFLYNGGAGGRDGGDGGGGDVGDVGDAS